jgi:hypothetical protein
VKHNGGMNHAQLRLTLKLAADAATTSSDSS